MMILWQKKFHPFRTAKIQKFSKWHFYFKKSVFLQPQNGRGVAQLVARYVRDVEAGSSSLLTPTKCLEDKFFRHFFCNTKGRIAYAPSFSNPCL